jgi:hypothetical protein
MARKSAKKIGPVKKGALHKDLGIPEDRKIPAKDLAVSPEDSPQLVKRKTFAKNAKKWKK